MGEGSTQIDVIDEKQCFFGEQARQTCNRQYPPPPSPLICMHNLVIVLYVTTMTTSNAFGGHKAKT